MALRVLFTRVELQLVKNNKYLALKRKYEEVEHGSSSSENSTKLKIEAG